MKNVVLETGIDPYRANRNLIKIPLLFKKNGNILKATTGTYCREVAANNISQIALGQYPIFNNKLKVARLMHKARVLFLNTKAPQTRVEAGIRILNMFEDKVGLSKTTVVKVNTADAFNYVNYMFVGDPTWYKSPVTISLYFLIIRYILVSGNVRKFNALQSIDDFYNYVITDDKFNYVKNRPLGAYCGSKTVADLHTVYHTHNKWEKLMSNISTLLPKNQTWVDRFKPSEIALPEKATLQYFGTQGIKALITNKCHLKIATKFNELPA